jgi:hypothetical protein
VTVELWGSQWGGVDTSRPLRVHTDHMLERQEQRRALGDQCERLDIEYRDGQRAGLCHVVQHGVEQVAGDQEHFVRVRLIVHNSILA